MPGFSGAVRNLSEVRICAATGVSCKVSMHDVTSLTVTGLELQGESELI